MNGPKSAHGIRRLLRFSMLSAEQWDRSKYLRSFLILAMTLFGLTAVVGWYQLAMGVHVMTLRLATLTGLAIIILVAAPRKWELITLSIGLTFILSILGTILRRAPLGVGLEIILATGALYFGCVYLGDRLKKHRGK